MDCLLDYIGLKGCNSEAPRSGKFLNSMPGMSTELVDNISSSDQITYKETWANIQSEAFSRMKDDILNILREDSNFKEIVYQTRRLTKFTRTTDVIDSSSYYNGLYLRIPESRYIDLYLRQLYVYSDTVVTTVLKVFDINDGSELYTQDIDLVVGFNSIEIDEVLDLKYGIMDVFIGVDASGFNSIKTQRDLYYLCDRDDVPCDHNHRVSNYLYEIWPSRLLLSDNPTFENIDKEGFGRGVAFGIDIRCSVESFICENKKSLEESWRHVLAWQTLVTKIGSYRLNLFTTSNLENTAYLRDQYEKRYMSMLKNVLKNIPVNDICLNCNDTLKMSYGGNLA